MDQAQRSSTVATTQRWLSPTRIGIAAVAATVVTRIILGNLVVNDWEDWSTFAGNAVGAVVEGLILGGIVFGLIVRLAQRNQRRRAELTGFVVGLVAVLTLAIPYSAPQPILGAAAVALGLVALDRGAESRRMAVLAIVFGTVVIAVWLGFMAFAVITSDWPVSY